MRKIFFVLMLTASVACSQKKGHTPDSNIFLPGQRLAQVKSDEIEEISGIAASARYPGLFWVHNDSGNGAEIFLINNKLDILLTVTLKGVVNRDWEDIPVGPGPVDGKSYVYIGEIGDNNAADEYKYIYRLEEPARPPAAKAMMVSSFDIITFQLPDGSKDCESLLVHPVTKNVYIISKREKPVYLYELKFPVATNDTVTARRVMPLPYRDIVSADFSPDGNAFIMKNYLNIYYWKINEDLFSSLRERPYILEYQPEPQGEAITFARDGEGYYTIGERTFYDRPYLSFYARKKNIAN